MSKPVKILYEDWEHEFIMIDKPSSIVCMPHLEALRDLTTTTRFAACLRNRVLLLS